MIRPAFTRLQWWALAMMLMLQTACAEHEGASPRSREKFTHDWKFHLGEVADAATPTFNDAQWRVLTLPHDWSIEGEFSKDNPAGPGGGALPGGIGWYRKTFTVPQSDAGKLVFIDFDGVYMNSEVFINGHSLGVRPFGYISFRYDLTPYLHIGRENVLAVRVDNSQQPNSRWYSGSGIYRNVWLTTVEPVHVDQWGTYVTTPVVSANEATVAVETTIANRTEHTVNAEVTTILIDSNGKPCASQRNELTIQSKESAEAQFSLLVNNPIRWTVDNPYMYVVRTEVRVDGVLTDRYDTPTGIRTFRFDAEKGFFLNDEPMKIKGVCQHHDLGSLGAAINIRAMERQLEMLREMGCNSIRTAHNPPAPELLELCDRMGFIVMLDAFDIWRKKKTAYDYSIYFNDWHEQDLTDVILRDRNHPSIMMWNIGNEVLEQWTHADADTLSIQEANLILNATRGDEALRYEGEGLSVNSLLTRKLAQMVRDLDPTRPITAGNNEPRPENHLFRADALDIIGYNYHEDWFARVPDLFPGKPFIITESTSALMTRGYYRMPSDSMYIWPERWDKPFFDESLSCSSYDNCHVPWGTTHEETWRWVKQNDFISGLYVWTGFDYLGEPTPYDFPARSSYFGIIDLAGFPKDVYYMYQSEWTDKPVLHVFPHWNHTPGETVDVWAYYSDHADEVELFLNGQSQGKRHKAQGEFHVSWRVAYAPGTIEVIGRKAGQEVLRKAVHTAGAPHHLRLTADRATIQADGEDLSFVSVEVVDEQGNVCPLADNLINFRVSDKVFIAGVDNGSQTSMESFKAPFRKAFYGKCMVVLQNTASAGNATLTASAEGLPDASIDIQIH